MFLGASTLTMNCFSKSLMHIKFKLNLDCKKPIWATACIGFILRDQKDAVIWRGPLKHGLIRQFLRDVRWGELDYLIVDSPPGTGDEPISVIQLLEDADGAIIVTTPQDVALTDVKKAITFCGHVKLPVIGVIENMSGFICPYCGKTVNIFKVGGGEEMALEMGVPFLGRLPLEPGVVEAGDSGKPYLQYHTDSETGKAFDKIINTLLSLPGGQNLKD
ncbi:MAG: Mrp/NBP35 family ATP-binding protein [Nitrospirota bacterium]